LIRLLKILLLFAILGAGVLAYFLLRLLASLILGLM